MKPINIIQNMIRWLAIFCIGFLAISGIFIYVEDTSWFGNFEIVFNPLYTIGSLFIFILIYFLVYKLYLKKPNWKWEKIFFWACFLIGVLCLLMLVEVSDDQANIFLKVLNLNGLAEEETWFKTYFSCYPNTINNVLFQSLFGTNYYIFFAYNFILYLLAYVYGNKIFELYNKKEEKIHFEILYIFCFPIALYINFYYGEITGIFGIVVSLYLISRIFLKANEKKKIIIDILLLFLLNFVVFFEKENYLIMIIAQILCLIANIFDNTNRKNNKISLYIILILLSSFYLTKPIAKNWASSLGIYKGKGDSLAYIAMGMHDVSDYDYRFPKLEGAWDGTNATIYEDTEEVHKQATLYDLNDISKSLENFQNNPLYAVKFYFNKINKQWNTNDFSTSERIVSYSTANGNLEKHAAVAKVDMYNQKYTDLKTWKDDVRMFVNNGERMLIYIVVFVVLLLIDEKEYTLLDWILIIAFMGYFLFSIIWEARPRYCIYGYFILLLFASLHIQALIDKIKLFKEKKNENTKIVSQTNEEL